MSLGVIFPGQGSQSVGMLADLHEQHAIVRQTFEQASSVLGYDLAQLCLQGPEDDLNRTDRTQPALLTAGVAVWRLWCEQGGALPSMMAGHSLGEYTALSCAGALDFADAVALVARRGEFMQEAVPAGSGAMAAILGLEDEAVARVCEAAANGEVVEPVNFNAPGQVVIAGQHEAVERAMAAASEAGAKRALPLPVSVPSHCSLMVPAARRLAEVLEDIEIKTPEIPVVHNVDAASRTDASEIRDALVRQLHNPVRWVQTIEAMRAGGVAAFIEAGPGRVLAGLGKRIDKSAPVKCVMDNDSLEVGLTFAREQTNA